MKLIDKDALAAEIERIEHETNYEPFTGEVLGKRCVCRSLLSFLDTIEVKEVDLWTELGNYIEHYRNRETGYTELGIAEHFFELGLNTNNPITAADRGTAEEIIINLKRVEQDYHIDLTKEMEWVRNQVKKGD